VQKRFKFYQSPDTQLVIQHNNLAFTLQNNLAGSVLLEQIKG